MMAGKVMEPTLRFPEFSGGWNEATGGAIFENSREKGHSGLPIYSVTINRGMVRRDSLERKMGNDAADELNLSVMKGDLAYNMMRMWHSLTYPIAELC